MTGRFHEAIHDLNSRSWRRRQRGDGLQRLRSEFARIFLIAATGEGGDDSGARTLYQAYARGWPNRSVWRLACIFRLPDKITGLKPFLDALAKAGMPQYLDERRIFMCRPLYRRS